MTVFAISFGKKTKNFINIPKCQECLPKHQQLSSYFGFLLLIVSFMHRAYNTKKVTFSKQWPKYICRGSKMTCDDAIKMKNRIKSKFI